MNIQYIKDEGIFHLSNSKTSYILQIIKGRFISLRYWGRKLHNFSNSNKLLFYDRGFGVNMDDDRTFSLESLPQDISFSQLGDFRSSSLEMIWKDETSVVDAKYTHFVILDEKPKMKEMPSTYGASKTLQLYFLEEAHQIQICLSYTLFADCDCIARSVKIQNNGIERCYIKKALSLNVDFLHSEFDLITFYGSHTNEKQICRRKLTSGITTVSSTRGTSSPQQTPFLAICDPNTDEDYGEVYAMELIYSGNFIANAEVSQYGTTRLQMGIHPDTFLWELKPKDSFQTPEAILVYSFQGLTNLSKQLYKVCQNHIVSPLFAKADRPILLNSWESAYFNFTQDKLIELATKAAFVGIELFVLDDGWFGNRNDDTKSLGDWHPNKDKFPKGLDYFIQNIKNKGLDFGIWVEPEMVNEDSELYTQHPDWILGVSYAKQLKGRNQYILDLSRDDVCEYIIECLSNILSKYDISYVKWDMNRHTSHLGSYKRSSGHQMEVAHRYVLGLYRILDTITKKFPSVLFESCSSGGGRFDLGMLYYMPQTWTSDNTDAICRSKIQYGTSFLFPPVTMGAHVSSIPNHQVGRNTPLKTRFAVAMSANLGYELDLTVCSKQELKAIIEQVSYYKTIRRTIQQGDFYRLKSPFDYQSYGWNFVSKNKQQVIVVYVRELSQPAYCVEHIRLKGLVEHAQYRDIQTNMCYGGDELMYSGISIPRCREDFVSIVWHFEKMSESFVDMQ